MKFMFSGALYRFVNYKKEIEIEAKTIGESINSLVEKYPDIKRTLLDNTGKISRSHQLFQNGVQLKMPEDGTELLARPIGQNDVLYVLTAITGG
jgi:hypothetical protein